MPQEYRVEGNQKLSMAGVPVTMRRKVFRGLARTLTAEDSGALCLWDTAAGFIYTLPTCAEGIWFDFWATVTATSLAHKFITASASEFLGGTIMQGTDTTYLPAAHDANPASTRAVSMNGTTTGGFKGDRITIVGSSATIWLVQGLIGGSGSEATPFAAS